MIQNPEVKISTGRRLCVALPARLAILPCACSTDFEGEASGDLMGYSSAAAIFECGLPIRLFIRRATQYLQVAPCLAAICYILCGWPFVSKVSSVLDVTQLQFIYRVAWGCD